MHEELDSDSDFSEDCLKEKRIDNIFEKKNSFGCMR